MAFSVENGTRDSSPSLSAAEKNFGFVAEEAYPSLSLDLCQKWRGRSCGLHEMRVCELLECANFFRLKHSTNVLLLLQNLGLSCDEPLDRFRLRRQVRSSPPETRG